MLPYSKHLKTKSRELRTSSTYSERTLWSQLRGKQLLGVQFYRQKPIGEYVVDFYAPKAKLVVEVDGSQHLLNEGIEKDQKRDRYLGGLGLEVIRFNSREVVTNTDEVVAVIYRKIKALLSD